MLSPDAAPDAGGVSRALSAIDLCAFLDLGFLFHVLVEVFLVGVIIWLLFRKSYQIDLHHMLTEKELDELIADWKHEPLTPYVDDQSPILRRPHIDGKLGKIVCIDGKKYINFATMDFLGLAADTRLEDMAVDALRRFGTGTCGPRAFYGTFDVHLILEERLAKFMHCEEAIVYSFGFSTIASAIPAYCKRGDVIFADRAVNFSIQKGLQASRSRIEFFEHNDIEDLERLLRLQREKDLMNPRKAKVTRRFIVVEGIYLYSGNICPLPDLIRLKWAYKVRLFLDESVSFGVLGKTGRGVTEHFDVDIADIDLISCSLELAAAGTGGFCCGRSFIIDHQRLSGAGYCYSASLPSPLTAALIRSLDIIIDEPQRIERLRINSTYLYERLKRLRRFEVTGRPCSPLFHVRPAGQQEADLLDRVLQQAMDDGVVLVEMSQLKEHEMFPASPSIKVAVTSEHTVRDLDTLLSVFEQFDKSSSQ